MPPVIRVVEGTGSGPTAVASYDTALAAAGVADYNLDIISSIIPRNWSVEAVGTAPDLGAPGGRLTVVQARETTNQGRATAGLGWLTGPGPGVFYEVEGDLSPRTAQAEIDEGLETARRLRDWTFTDQAATVTTTRSSEAYASAVVLAVYGESAPL